MTEQTKLQRLAEYYDTHDTSDELKRAELVEGPVDPDPMISLSLRLPKSLLDWVRTQARTEHIKPTQLIRRWIEEHRSTGEPSLEQRVRRLEDLVQRSAGHDS
jgi:CopG antitoxin of type II toxin-antitoxin system